MTVHRQCFSRDTRETGSTISDSGSSDLHNYTVQPIILILIALSRRQWYMVDYALKLSIAVVVYSYNDYNRQSSSANNKK